MEQPTSPKLLDQVRQAIRVKHYSYRTEQTYVDWIRRFILFHNKKHPKDMGIAEVEAFLGYLAVVGNVAASTQNQALSALLFLYKIVLEQELESVDALRAKKSRYLPTVLSELPSAHLTVERGLLPSTTTASSVVDLSPYCFGLT